MNINLPDVSIIIPTYNEQKHLPALLEQLSLQQNISLQIVVVDGGSDDNSMQTCLAFAKNNNCICVATTASRPKQMNFGAKKASSSLLLFLHADSVIDDTHLLANALKLYQRTIQQAHSSQIAGHFSLQFNETQKLYPKGFYFYAAKTSLNRPETINGDQGLLINKSFFESIGRFDDDLHYMEDARISQKIFENGIWITLPGVIRTSARRFIVEGLAERQTLNSFLCNFNHIGLLSFFEEAGAAYKVQVDTQRLKLRPFLRIIHKLMLERGFLQACKYWYKTGAYVAPNSWQLVFIMDCNRHRNLGDPATQVNPKLLTNFDRYCSWFFKLSIVHAITAVLTLIWFYSLWLKHRDV